MKLIDMTVEQYSDLLGSSAPAPGGGSASALCGVQGAALIAMVAGLTIGKKKYALEQDLCVEVEKKATELKNKFILQVDKDSLAFELVSAALKLPKETDDEKSERKKAISAATLVATQVPFETMRMCLETLHLAKSLVGHSNANAASDLGVAALNLIAGIKGAWLNVLINLGGLSEEKTKDFRSIGAEMVNIARKEGEEIYNAVLDVI